MGLSHDLPMCEECGVKLPCAASLLKVAVQCSILVVDLQLLTGPDRSGVSVRTKKLCWSTNREYLNAFMKLDILTRTPHQSPF